MMRSWTRSEKIAAWTLLVAIASCPLVYYGLAKFGIIEGFSAQKHNQPQIVESLETKTFKESLTKSLKGNHGELSLAQKNVIEALRKKTEEETIAFREEALRIYKERIEVRKKRIQKIADELDDDANGPKFDRISLKNSCDKSKIFVAVGYKDLAGEWVSRGWWSVKPKTEIQTDIKTRNPHIYIYAEPKKSDIGKWSGDNKDDSAQFNVIHGKFYLINKESPPYENYETVSFFYRYLGENWTNHKVEFVCNN